jgi:hypothetical protein
MGYWDKGREWDAEPTQETKKMTKDKWMTEARRYAKHAFCYEGMVDEYPEHFEDQFEDGSVDPYEAVDEFAENVGLDRADGFYGINSGTKFVKEA